MTDEPVGAVIVNYNAGDHLLACVESLGPEGIDQIIVVDNGSSDGSMNALSERYPHVKTLSLPNPGYGTAMNRGAEQLDANLVFLLNPDTVVRPGAVKTLSEALASDTGLGIVGPKLENNDGSLYPSARQFPSFVDAIGHAVLGLVWANNPWSRRYKMLDWDHASEREVDWVSGAAMLCRRSAFESVRGFDEAYFMYMEDVDLCWRIRKAGWKVAYEPRALVTHVRGVSTDLTPYKMIIAHHKSLLRYNLRTADGFSKVLLPVVVAGLVIRAPLTCLHRYIAGRRAAK